MKLDAGDPRGTIGHLRAALAFDPDDRELRLRLAQALDLSGDRAAAIAELERILSSGPDAEAERILAALGG
ncbi:MAG: tetratricopeptide repeat protein [Planctomycetota bacterium]